MSGTPVMLVLREGGESAPVWTLSVRGTADRARVELRTDRVRMVVVPETSGTGLLDQVLGTADELEEIQGRLRRLADEVPDPSDDMLEHRIPYDVETALLTTLECVAEDDLGAAIEKLRLAVAATPAELREEWEKEEWEKTDVDAPSPGDWDGGTRDGDGGGEE